MATAATPGTVSTGGAFLPGAPAFAGIGNLPGAVQWSDQLPTGTFAGFGTDPGFSAGGDLFPDPSANFFNTLGSNTTSVSSASGALGLDPNALTAGTNGGGSGSGELGPIVNTTDLPDVSVSANPPDPTATTQIPGASGNPITQGSTAASAALGQIGAFAGNWFVRVGVIVLGLVLIAAAAWNLSKGKTNSAKPRLMPVPV